MRRGAENYTPSSVCIKRSKAPKRWCPFTILGTLSLPFDKIYLILNAILNWNQLGLILFNGFGMGLLGCATT